MQQTQAQLPTPTTPQKRKRGRVPRDTIIGIACLVAIIIGGFWIATSVGWIHSLFGISPTNLATIASIIVAVLGLLFMFIPIVPANDALEQSVPATPAQPVINVNINNAPSSLFCLHHHHLLLHLSIVAWLNHHPQTQKPFSNVKASSKMSTLS